MKQYITMEQLKEIDFEKARKLDSFINIKYPETKQQWKKCFELKYEPFPISVFRENLHIGKMIEILTPYEILIKTIEVYNKEKDIVDHQYQIEWYEDDYTCRERREELVDALWEAVKSVV